MFIEDKMTRILKVLVQTVNEETLMMLAILDELLKAGLELLCTSGLGHEVSIYNKMGRYHIIPPKN